MQFLCILVTKKYNDTISSNNIILFVYTNINFQNACSN